MGERPVYLSTDPQAGSAPGYLSTDPSVGSSWLESAKSFVSNFGATVDPRPALKVLYDVSTGLGGMLSGDATQMRGMGEDIKGIASAQLEQFKKAKSAYDKGQYSEAVGHTIAGGLPLLGPVAAHAGEQIGSGDVAGGFGTAAGLLAPIGAGEAIRALPKTASVTPKPAPLLTPQMSDAVRFGETQNIPIDAATATNRPLIATIQKRVGDTMGGAGTAEAFKARQAQGLATVGEQLAAKGYSQSVTPEQAGASAQRAVTDVVHARNLDATDAYDRLRALADQQQQTVQVRGPSPAPPDAPVRFQNNPNALPDRVFESAYQDARQNGYQGTRSALRERFDQQLQSGFDAIKERDRIAEEYGPQALLGSIRELGGVRPFTKDLATGAPLRGDFASIVESFGAKSGWGQKGAGSIFRNKGLGLDDMVDQLRQDPRWRTVIQDENDLLDALDGIAREGPPKAPPKATAEEALSISDARPGAQWWTPREDATIALPVDLRTIKPQLQPVLDRLMREKDVTGVLMGDKGRAASALAGILRAPDFAPLSDVDSALGDLKSFARADNPDLRTIGQGVVATAVKQLDALVRSTASNAGPDVQAALEEGRQATRAKYGAAGVLQQLQSGSGEAVAAYRRLTAPNDSAIGQLRDVAQQAPHVLPQIGRAFLDDLMGQATINGSFEKAKTLQTRWEKLGDQTKMLLYRDPAYIKDVDNFFRLAAKMSENPNPSGTARVNNIFNTTSAAVGYPIAKLLYSKTGVRLLTEGFRIPVQSPAAVANYIARLSAALRLSQSIEPVMAGDNQDTPPSSIAQQSGRQ
jgi:hypothetical protein